MENELLKSTLTGILQILRGQQEELEALQLKHGAVLSVLNPKLSEEYEARLANLTDGGDPDELSGELQLLDVAINSIRQSPKVG